MDAMHILWGLSAMMAGVMCAICGFALGADWQMKKILKGSAR